MRAGLWQWVKRQFFTRKFLLYSAIGFLNTFHTALYSTLFAHFLQDNVASTLGYAVSLSIAYLLNAAVVFRQKPQFSAFLRFVISYLPNFALYTVISFFTINLLGWPQFLATALAALLGVPITFLMVKLFTFRSGR